MDSWIGAIDHGKYVRGGAAAGLVEGIRLRTSPTSNSRTRLRIGVGSEALVWFTSYLSGRSQRVCCNQEAAQWKPVSRGVPQGSCLSPLLFNIFVRNIPTIAETECAQYADNFRPQITESAVDKDIEVVAEKLTSSFNSVKQFCASKQLVVNT